MTVAEILVSSNGGNFKHLTSISFALQQNRICFSFWDLNFAATYAAHWSMLQWQGKKGDGSRKTQKMH